MLNQVTGISMQSVLVGEDLNACAFVYGSLSFLDKMSCGLALYVLESYQREYRYCLLLLDYLVVSVDFSQDNQPNLFSTNSEANTMVRFMGITYSFLDVKILFLRAETSPIIESCNSVMGCVSITRYGLGLVPASCAVIGLVVIFTMDLDRTTISRPLIQPLLA